MYTYNTYMCVLYFVFWIHPLLIDTTTRRIESWGSHLLGFDSLDDIFERFSDTMGYPQIIHRWIFPSNPFWGSLIYGKPQIVWWCLMFLSFFRTNKYCAFGLHLNWSTMPGELKPWGRLLGESPPRTDHENKGLSSLMSSVWLDGLGLAKQKKTTKPVDWQHATTSTRLPSASSLSSFF